MKTKVEKKTPCRRMLVVTASSEEVLPEYKKVMGDFVRQAALPGFRKGRAPEGLVEKRFAKDIVEETKDRLVPRLYRAALRSEGIVPVAIIDVHDVVFSQSEGISFKVTVDVPPEFKLPKYHKIRVKGEEVKVTEEEVEKVFAGIRDSAAKYENVSGRGVGEGDFISCDFSGECEGRPVREMGEAAAVYGDGKDYTALVGSGRGDLIPGFSDGIKGAEEGKEKTLEVVFPPDFKCKPLAGKKAIYKVVVKSIRERIQAEVDAEFLKHFGVDSEQALKAKVREDLQGSAERKEKDRVKMEIVKTLIEKTDIDVPESVVEQERNMMIRDMVRRISAQGGTREQIEEQKDGILEAAANSSAGRVKSAYILAKIAEEEKIDVSDDEADGRVKELAARYGMTPERLRGELEKRNGVETLKSDIRTEKTLEFLYESAKLK